MYLFKPTPWKERKYEIVLTCNRISKRIQTPVVRSWLKLSSTKPFSSCLNKARVDLLQYKATLRTANQLHSIIAPKHSVQLSNAVTWSSFWNKSDLKQAIMESIQKPSQTNKNQARQTYKRRKKVTTTGKAERKTQEELANTPTDR